jgi:hypothetical protein
MSAHQRHPARTYHILGVPLRTGSLAPGNEDDAHAYRDAHLLERLREAGCQAVDDGDVPIPSYLPHHAVPPIREGRHPDRQLGRGTVILVPSLLPSWS